jgi:hypothetical protein
VVEAAATAILRGAPIVQILATSREPLREDGEQLFRLSSLGEPPASAHLSAAEALAFPAVELFVERVAARLDNFQLTDVEAPSVAELGRKLDGIALAIEFAAGRVESLGVRGLGTSLDKGLRLRTMGRRPWQTGRGGRRAYVIEERDSPIQPQRRALVHCRAPTSQRRTCSTSRLAGVQSGSREILPDVYRLGPAARSAVLGTTCSNEPCPDMA